MAVIAATFTDVGPNAKMVTWTGLATNDTGQPVELPEFGDRTVTVEGTFGGATIVFNGSNDGVGYYNCTDPQGTAFSKAVAAMEVIEEAPRFVRPEVTGGAGVALQCRMYARRGAR